MSTSRRPSTWPPKSLATSKFPVIVAPPVWSGFTHYNMGFAGTISLRLETFQALIADICRSIHANGFHRIITVNGHGGNAAPCRAVSWQLAEEDIFTLSFNWWDAVEKELHEWSATDEDVGHGGKRPCNCTCDPI